jgi:hypothetical protein
METYQVPGAREAEWYSRPVPQVWVSDSNMKLCLFAVRYRIDAITLFGLPAEGPHGFHSLGK